MSILDAWLEESAENKTLLDEESLILEVAEQFWLQLTKSKTSRSELARRMDISKARVSKLLDGSNNLTLRKVANMATALNMKINFSLEQIKTESNASWEEKQVISRTGCKLYKFPNTSSQNWDNNLRIAL